MLKFVSQDQKTSLKQYTCNNTIQKLNSITRSVAIFPLLLVRKNFRLRCTHSQKIINTDKRRLMQLNAHHFLQSPLHICQTKSKIAFFHGSTFHTKVKNYIFFIIFYETSVLCSFIICLFFINISFLVYTIKINAIFL